MKNYFVIGIMSGTSIDGVDIVYVNFSYDESWTFKIIDSKTYDYDNQWQSILKNLSNSNIDSIKQIDKNYTKVLSNFILEFINEFSIQKIDFISSHGHTALHDPLNSMTYQIGNLPELSSYTKHKVIYDFRTQDVEFGGQGAPLVPVGEKFLFPEYNTLINLGGFANITKRTNDSLVAYDICPVNIVLNRLCNLVNLKFDNKGKLASSGKLKNNLFNDLQSLKYYNLNPPKSLGVEWVNKFVLPLLDKFSDIAVKDLLHTFSNHIAKQISANIESNTNVLITGGGAYNDYLIQRIRDQSNCKIHIPDPRIIEYKEAVIFAFLGVLRNLNINNCYSSVTGAKKDHCSGKIIFPRT